MSFQGADVDGLDRTANTCMEGADFADTVAKALEILVAALEAMSWTGFAAALAAYLKAVVIPWVKYIAKCLRIFGSLLQLASSKQKGASEDSPAVSIPATAWNPPPAPPATRVEPPRLSSPQPAIQQTDGGTGAQTGGGTSVTPITSIGRTDGGASIGTVTGGGSVTTTTGISPDGELWTRTTVSGGALSPGTVTTPTTIGGSGAGAGAGPGTGPGGGAASAVTPGIDNCFGDGGSIGGTGSVGSGGAGSAGGIGSGSGGGSGSVGGPSSGSIGAGTGGGTAGGSGGGSGTESSTSAGNPGVQSSPLSSRAVLGNSSGGVGTGSVEAIAPVSGGGAGAALAAAPLGLAGVGGAALAALRAKGLHDGDDQEEDDAI